MSATHRPTARDWFVVFACLVCQIGMGAGGYIFPVFLKPVTEALGWSRVDYALATPIMSSTVALTGPLVGWSSDRHGPRLVLGAGSVLMSVALLGAGMMQSLAQFYVVALAIGVAVACLGDLPTGAAIAHRFRQRRGLALGVVYIGSNIGGALVPLVAALLAADASWRSGFIGIGAVLWVVLLPMALSVTAAGGADEALRLGSGQAAPSRSNAEAERLDWRALLRERDFWLLFWVLAVFYVYRLGVNTHLPAFLSDLGYSQIEAATSFSVTLALGIAGKLLAGTIADRVGARAAVIGNFALIAVASALLLRPGAWGAMPIFLLLHGAATAAEDVVVPLMVAQRFGIDALGRVYGLLLLALVPGGWLGPALGGWSFDATGGYGAAFVAFVVTNITAVVALVAVRSMPPREPLPV
jgi:MFS family permease